MFRMTFVVPLLLCALARSSEQTKPIDPANMDTSVKPGEDFYRYANGKWLAQHPVPPDESRFASFDEVVERNRKILHEILDDAAQQTGAPKGSAIPLVGDLYASAM